MLTKRQIIDQILMSDFGHLTGTKIFDRLFNNLLKMDEQSFIDVIEETGFKVLPIIKNHYILSL